MKVLLVSPVFPPAIGGIEQHVFNLAKELNQKGVKADVLTTEIGAKKFREKIVVEGFNVFRVKTGLKNNSDLSVKGNKMIFPLAKKIFSLMKKEKYDLLHAHCPFTLASCIPAKFYFKVSLIATIHGNWINCIKGRRYFDGRICNKKDYPDLKRCSGCLNQNRSLIKLKQVVLQKLAENCNSLIAVSSDVRESIKLNKKIPITVIPNVSSEVKGLSKGKARKKLRIKSEKVILFIGSLIEEKGAMILLQSLKQIIKKHRGIAVHLLYGFAEKRYLGEVKDYIKRERIAENIYFHEAVPNKKVRELFMPASDLIVLPSLWPEPCSTIATEAMSQGIPLIASRVGGFKDLIKEGFNGLLFSPGNSIELARKINSVLNDKEKRKKLRSNSIKEFNRSLNWKAVSKKIIGVYEQALKEKAMA